MRDSVLCKPCIIIEYQNQGKSIDLTLCSHSRDCKLGNKFTMKGYSASCAPRSSSGLPYGIKVNLSVFPGMAETVCLQDPRLHKALHRPQFSTETRQDGAWARSTRHQEAARRHPPQASTTQRPRQPLSDTIARPADSGCDWGAEGPQQHYLKA